MVVLVDLIWSYIICRLVSRVCALGLRTVLLLSVRTFVRLLSVVVIVDPLTSWNAVLLLLTKTLDMGPLVWVLMLRLALWKCMLSVWVMC